MLPVSHKSEGHVHETHDHKPSSPHGEEREEKERKAEGKGILYMQWWQFSQKIFLVTLLILSMTTVFYQSPTLLRDTYMRHMATNQQRHLCMGRKERRSIKVYAYMYCSGRLMSRCSR